MHVHRSIKEAGYNVHQFVNLIDVCQLHLSRNLMCDRNRILATAVMKFRPTAGKRNTHTESSTSMSENFCMLFGKLKNMLRSCNIIFLIFTLHFIS